MKAVSVAASRRYDILIERGLLNRAGKLVRSVTNAGTVMLVSDDSVWPLYGETVQKSLEDTGVSVCRFVFPHGEGSKCAKTYLALLDALCENRLTRADAVVALGGGVFFSSSKNGAFPSTAYLMTSAHPSRKISSGRESRQSGSQSTSHG